MTVFQWIGIASTLSIDGLEFYSGFLNEDDRFIQKVSDSLESHDLEMPMLCCSPDFTQPDAKKLEAEIAKERRMIELTASLGGRYCRVLSGQRRPELPRERGIDQVVSAIASLLPVAAEHGVILTLENHYKDNYWRHPEFAQQSEVFLEIVSRIDSPHFAVNYDPSNAWLAGEDPIELLESVKDRVATMHASDRYLKYGTIEELRNEENSEGYANRLAHGVIGDGLNDYDRIFGILNKQGFDSWISIEDGVNGLEELQRSIEFLRSKIAEHF